MRFWDFEKLHWVSALHERCRPIQRVTNFGDSGAHASSLNYNSLRLLLSHRLFSDVHRWASTNAIWTVSIRDRSKLFNQRRFTALPAALIARERTHVLPAGQVERLVTSSDLRTGTTWLWSEKWLFNLNDGYRLYELFTSCFRQPTNGSACKVRT